MRGRPSLNGGPAAPVAGPRWSERRDAVEHGAERRTVDLVWSAEGCEGSRTTASQAAMEDGSAVIALICACAARASMQAPDQRHGEPSSHGGDRVRHVPFGSDRRRRGVVTLGKARRFETPGATWA